MNANITPYNPTIEETVQISQIAREYESGQAYISNLKLKTDIDKALKYYEGKQWSDVTKETADLPRPIFNIVKMIIDVQTSKILNNPISLHYVADNDQIATDEVTSFANFIRKEINQKELDRQAVSSGLKKGTFIYHYYWDKKAIGTRGRYEGGMRGRIINPLNFVVSDPTEPDIQKQKYIIYSTYEDVVSVRGLCDKKERKALIVNESGIRDDNALTNENTKVVKVYTKFFRKNGEVYYQLATRNTVIHDPIPCNPLIIQSKISKKLKKIREEQKDLEVQLDGRLLEELFEDGATLSIPTKPEDFDDDSDTKYKFYYYPFVVGTFYPRDESIYGLSQITSMIGVQQAINTLPAFALLNAQLFASPKIVARKDALKGQEITNKIGETLTDNLEPGKGQGFYTLPVSPMTGETMNLTAAIIEMLRMTTNTTEIVTGDMIGKDISGVAIGLLQAQDQQATSLPSEVFKSAQEQIGKIWEQYFFLYYRNKKYSVEMSDIQKSVLKKEGKSEEEIATMTQKEFNGEKYLDKDFHIVIEAGTGTKFSEAQSISVLNLLLQTNQIDAETYIDMLPQNVVPFRAKFKEYLQAKELSEVEQLKQLTAQQQGELEQLSKYAGEQEKAIKELVSNLNKSNQAISSLQKEYSQKITQVNDFIMSMNGQAKQGNHN